MPRCRNGRWPSVTTCTSRQGTRLMMVAEHAGIPMLAELVMRQALAHGPPETSSSASQQDREEKSDLR